VSTGDAVVVADVDEDHQFDRIDQYLLLGRLPRGIVAVHIVLNHALDGLLSDVRSHHCLLLQAGETFAAEQFLCAGVLSLAGDDDSFVFGSRAHLLSMLIYYNANIHR
jgi:hypothetical protein